MKAIIYTSSAGHTKRYAEMLSEELNIPFYTIRESRGKIAPSDPVIYMGWLRNGEIMGYDSISRKYKVKALIAVGMSPEKEAAKRRLELNYSSSAVKSPKFYLPGGFSRDTVRFPYSLGAALMKKLYNTGFGIRMTEQNLNEAGLKRALNEEEDYVSRDHLDGFLEWYRG